MIKDVKWLGVLSSILGGYMSSRLFMSLKRRGLAYVVKCGNTFYKDVGLISITAGVPNDKITESIQIIMDELKKIKNEELTNDELEKAVTNLTNKNVMSLEDTSNVAEYYGIQLLLQNKVENFMKDQEKIKK